MHSPFLIGLLASFLPARFRPAWLREYEVELRSSAMLTGSAQMLVCLGELIYGFRPFVQSQSIDPSVAVGGAETAGETAVMGFGLIILLAYLLRPLSVALLYFSIEGAARLVAAVASGESIGTLPVYLLCVIERKTRKEIREFKLGARIRDTVFPAPDGETEYELVIASCRPKDWNHSLTISHEGRLFELVRWFETDPPRRFVYLLREAPQSKVVRGLHQYDPDEGITAVSISDG